LPKRRERTQKRLLRQFERLLSIASAREQAIAHDASVMPFEESVLSAAIAAGSAAHEFRRNGPFHALA
jgi:hypothetical protein